MTAIVSTCIDMKVVVHDASNSNDIIRNDGGDEFGPSFIHQLGMCVSKQQKSFMTCNGVWLGQANQYMPFLRSFVLQISFSQITCHEITSLEAPCTEALTFTVRLNEVSTPCDAFRRSYCCVTWDQDDA